MAGELDAEQRHRLRQLRSKLITETLRQWRVPHRKRASDGTAIAKAIDSSLNRWTALTRFLEDGAVPVDNNWIENRIRPIALGRSNWLFVASLRGGQRTAAAMSLIESAKLNGHDPHCYLKDVLQRLPTQPPPPERGAAAAPLNTVDHPLNGIRAIGKRDSPDAYRCRSAVPPGVGYPVAEVDQKPGARTFDPSGRLGLDAQQIPGALVSRFIS